MKFIKTGLLALSIISSTCFAHPFSNSNLPQRCHQAAQKLEKIAIQQSDTTCMAMLSGVEFSLAGQNIASNDLDSAKYYLEKELKDLKYAATIGCNGQATIKWAISEAQQIKDIIS